MRSFSRRDSTEAWSRGTSIGASSRCGDVLAVDVGVFSKRLDAGALPLFDSSKRVVEFGRDVTTGTRILKPDETLIHNLFALLSWLLRN
jgi:hypothetical protein